MLGQNVLMFETNAVSDIVKKLAFNTQHGNNLIIVRSAFVKA